LNGAGVLFIPESKTFPSFDYAIVVYKQTQVEIFLKQTTISTIDSHHRRGNGKTYVDNLLNRTYVIKKEGEVIKGKLDTPNNIIFHCLN